MKKLTKKMKEKGAGKINSSFVCKALLVLVLWMALCGGCQPFGGSGAYASPVSGRDECSLDHHCNAGEYCFPQTNKCNPCNADICAKLLRTVKPNVCVKSSADCGACLPEGEEHGEATCHPRQELNNVGSTGNEGNSGKSGKPDFHVTGWPVLQWISIIAAVTIVPFMVVCLVYVSKTYRRWRGNPTDVTEFLVTPVAPKSRELAEPSAPHETQALVTVPGFPSEYSPPPYAPFAAPATAMAIVTRPEQMDTRILSAGGSPPENNSIEQAVPFNLGNFSDLQEDEDVGEDHEIVAPIVNVQLAAPLNNGPNIAEVAEEEIDMEPAEEIQAVEIPENDSAVSDMEMDPSQNSSGNAGGPIAASTPHSRSNHDHDSGNGSIEFSFTHYLSFDFRYDHDGRIYRTQQYHPNTGNPFSTGQTSVHRGSVPCPPENLEIDVDASVVSELPPGTSFRNTLEQEEQVMTAVSSEDESESLYFDRFVPDNEGF